MIMFFVVNVCNNYAFDFNIPMPLHMIFRAVSIKRRFNKKKDFFFIKIKFFIHFFKGSLIANMIMGILILKKEYEFSKYLSVFMITAGIVLCTIVSGSNVVSKKEFS